MLEYCQVHRFDADATDAFLWLIPRLDSKYMEWHAAKTSGGAKKGKLHGK